LPTIGVHRGFCLLINHAFRLPGELLSLCLRKEKVTKEKAHPTSGPACGGVPSFRRCSRGTSRRAIPGPSRLSRHPCRSTPYATIPLSLLTGPGPGPNLWCKLGIAEVAFGSLMVPTLRVGTHLGTLRVPQTWSVCGCMHTQSVDTISARRSEPTTPPGLKRKTFMRANSPSVGRVEVLRRGTSRRDAARGLKGHGWPL